jgi:hypothetical protein
MSHSNVIVIPPLDYHLSDFVAAALRYGGFRAMTLPPSCEATRAAWEKYVFGQKCRPLQMIVGDVMKWLTNNEVNLEESQLFLPAFSGCDCAFGMYGTNLQLIAAQSGFADLKLFAPDLARPDALLNLLGMDLVQVLWRAVLAAELLAQMLLLTRPQAEDKDGVAKVYAEAAWEIEAALEEKQALPAQLDKLAHALDYACRDFAAVSPQPVEELSLIGMVGEPYIRYSTMLNSNMVTSLEKNGGRVWLKPLTDELEGLLHPPLAKAFAYDATTLKNVCSAFFTTMGLSAPFATRQELVHKGRRYIPDDPQLDGIASHLGRFMHMAENGIVGMVSLWSLFCLRTSIEHGFYNHFREGYDDIPLWRFHCSGNDYDYSETMKVFWGDIQKYRIRCGLCQ